MFYEINDWHQVHFFPLQNLNGLIKIKNKKLYASPSVGGNWMAEDGKKTRQ